MKKLLVFDYDRTLAPPVSKAPLAILKEITRLLENNYVAVMSGGRSFEQMIELFIDHLPLKEANHMRNLYICPSYGNKIYEWDNGFKMIYRAKDMTKEEKGYIYKALESIDWKEFGIEKVYGDQILDRGTSISVDCLGKDAPKEVKEKWDPEKQKRKVIKEGLDQIFKDKFDVYATGRNTVDIVTKNNTKADNTERLARILNIPLKNVVFTGDEFTRHGNDFPLLELDDITINTVKGPEETLKLLKRMK